MTTTPTAHDASTIVCPSWCVVPANEHHADLANWEGRVIHWNDRDRERLISHSRESWPDGSLTDEPSQFHIDGLPDQITAPEALALARHLIEAVEEELR